MSADLTFSPGKLGKNYVSAHNGGRSFRLEFHQVEQLIGVFLECGLLPSYFALEDAYVASGGIAVSGRKAA